jgi:phytoene desaturase
MNGGKQIVVVGAGFAGLSAACVLAKAGHKVTLLEKNDQPGGRARVWESNGFKFDMGPSWYWMPDVFESFFALFGKKPQDFYELKRLDPSYRIYFGKDDLLDVPAKLPELESLFESIEPGSGKQLKHFMQSAAYKYKTGMGELILKPSVSLLEYADLRLIPKIIKLQLLKGIDKHIRHYFKNLRLIQLLEFPALFLGAKPKDTPATYSLMNYADLVLGTWYPMGGINEIVKAMVRIAENSGVDIRLNTEVERIVVDQHKATIIQTNKGDFKADVVISGADYEHTDQQLIEKPYRNYDEKYWDSRVMSPSALLFYIGVDKKLKYVQHHNLFFDEDFNRHADDIYTHPQWPEKPLFYVCCPSKTDPSVAPEDGENLFFLIPLAPGLEDTEALREKYFQMLISRFEKITGEHITGNIIVKRSYAMNDFSADYHSFKGNAYGLANTLMQSAIFKPKIRSKHIKNLFYTGQLTVPGPGVPPAIISGQIVAKEVLKYLDNS